MLIGNLPLEITEDELAKFFSTVGKVAQIEILKDKTGRGRGFAFVTMANQEQAEKAIATLQNAELRGRVLSISPARNSKQTKPKSFFGFWNQCFHSGR